MDLGISEWKCTEMIWQCWHGDGELDLFEEEVQKRHEINQAGRMGNRNEGISCVRLLNIILTLNGKEVTVEADPSHQELIVQGLGLQK